MDQMGFNAEMARNREEAMNLLDRLLSTARADAIFGEPISSGDQVAITASESKLGAWFGFGMGGGSTPPSEKVEGQEEGRGYGGGGGGGGMSMARPVAVINLRAGGVRIEPVVDITKVGIALFAALGSMLIMLAKMMAQAKR